MNNSFQPWKNDTTFVRMRSGDLLGDAKMSKKGTCAPSNLTFLLIAKDENGFRRIKKGRSTKRCLRFFLIFVPGLSYDLSKFSDEFTPFFDFERP